MSLSIRKQETPILRNLSILLYGMPKIGKTSEAAKFPSPLLLNCEPGGTDLLAGAHDVLDIHSLDELERLLPQLKQSEYKTLVLDGFTWLINQSAREYAAKSGSKDRRRAYMDVTDTVTRTLGNLLSAGKIVIATGQSRVIDVEIHDEEDQRPRQPGPRDERTKVEIRPDINPRLSDSVFALFSVICYCFPGANGSKMITKPVENQKRRILAGDRSGLLPQLMPLDAKAMMDALKAGTSKPAPPPPTNGTGEKVNQEEQEQTNEQPS